ncbi:MAG: hypothetical protein WAQ24_03710 [Candidatus Saccharimonadales bacterium]
MIKLFSFIFRVKRLLALIAAARAIFKVVRSAQRAASKPRA